MPNPLMAFARLMRPGPRAEKQSRVAPAIAFQALGRPVWTPRDYAALADEGFQRNAVAYRCVRAIAESAANVPWLLYEGDRELAEHPLLTLLERPNAGQAGPDLFESWFGFLQVAGNAYLELVEADGRPRELHVLRPDRMKVVPGASGWPAAYEYAVNGRVVTIPCDAATGESPVLHMRLFHPLDDHYGMSPLEAAACAIDIHNAAGGWNKALLDNAARPSGALVYKGGEAGANLSEDQFERLKRELADNYAGPANAGRPLLLEGGLDWKPMGLSPKDMDFIAAKNAAARDIALAFGVPPMLLGIPGDNTYANYREANRAFWRASVLPLLGRTARALTRWLGPHYEGGTKLRLWYDADAIEALSSEREALWERVGKAGFLSDDEKREAVGYGRVTRPSTSARD
ncbi:phage portal protein [uncultured Parvibaculum sp.]|uniref:phage portal protein n=1 Tax=uncultured Parvibaculum sp. TaxID=291828 RepID=UPI0030DAB224|tara:strand:- start:1310 stop:2518 length:1209 start_codon:yes stop_codon:yes gene_type:complete